MSNWPSTVSAVRIWQPTSIGLAALTATMPATLTLAEENSPAGSQIELRFEMDTLVLMHTCPHPLDLSESYPSKPLQVDLLKADPAADDDYCKNFRPENQRGFQNNALYCLSGQGGL